MIRSFALGLIIMVSIFAGAILNHYVEASQLCVEMVSSR